MIGDSLQRMVDCSPKIHLTAQPLLDAQKRQIFASHSILPICTFVNPFDFFATRTTLSRINFTLVTGRPQPAGRQAGSRTRSAESSDDKRGARAREREREREREIVGTKTSVTSFAMEEEIFDLGCRDDGEKEGDERRKKEEHLSMRQLTWADRPIVPFEAFCHSPPIFL